MDAREAVEILFGGTDSSRAAEAAGFISDDVVMHEGGDNLRSGVYRGKAAMNDLMATVSASCEEFRSDLVSATSDDRRVVTIAHATGKREGLVLDTHVVTLIDLDEQGRIAEIRDLPYDWAAWDAFFAR